MYLASMPFRVQSWLSSRKKRSVLWAQGCNDVIFFETRKHKDLYIWMAKTPSGPTIKFHCTNGTYIFINPNPLSSTSQLVLHVN